MAGINQIQMSFIPGEDRILMRMNTVASEGFQFWLTRRFVKLLWPLLLQMLARDSLVLSQQTVEAKKEVLSFQQEQAAQKMDYSKSYQEQVNTQPLGDKPLLLAKAGVKENDNNSQTLGLHPEQGQGIDIALDKQLLHSVCKLLQDTVSKTDWDLDLSQSLATSAAVEQQQPVSIN